MNKTFVKSADLKLINGGYMTVGESNKPVTHAKFVEVQQHAEYIVTFAKIAKGKKLVSDEVTTIEEIKRLVDAELNSSKSISFVALPTAPKQELAEKQKKETLAFANFQKESNKINKVNTFLNNNGYGLLQEFEEFGLYFDEGITKLNRIYTLDEVKTALLEVIDLL